VRTTLRSKGKSPSSGQENMKESWTGSGGVCHIKFQRRGASAASIMPRRAGEKAENKKQLLTGRQWPLNREQKPDKSMPQPKYKGA